MNTASLRKFATWARTELITQVHARIDQVLAPGSLERVEHASTVSALEKALNAHGDDHIADTVAYIWFNRIIALRFMDANNYTATGVVSPADPTTYGQPEILTLAKRGEFTPYTPKATQQTILSLLNGTKPSTNPQAEAYNLLLKAECDHRRTVMPFLFGDAKATYIDILAPADMLSTDSVLMHAQNTLTAQACADVEVIGWLYQFYISERKDEVFAGFKKGKKAGVDEIPAATQLFTPHWIVRYLAENSIGRLWMQNHPDSHLVDHMDYYIPPVDDTDTDFLKITSPEQLTVIDPACGSGHMLTYSFDLLYAIYEEEGYAPSDIPGLILTHNLYGTEIDPRAGALAAFALMMKARGKQRTFLKQGNRVEPHIQVIEPIEFTDQQIAFLSQGILNDHDAHEFWNAYVNADTLGSLINPNPDAYQQATNHITTLDDTTDLLLSGTLAKAQQHLHQTQYLTNHYAVAIANPPYMIRRQMGAQLSSFIKKNYPAAASDLFATFILRCLKFTGDSGQIAMITKQTWMFGSSFKQLRHDVLTSHPLFCLAHLGTNAFDTISGEVVNTTAFIADGNRSPAQKACFIDLQKGKTEAEKDKLLNKESPTKRNEYWVASSSFQAIPGQPLAYWLSDAFLKSWENSEILSEVAFLKSGISTGNNEQFERQWYEVSLKAISAPGAQHNIGTKRWTPCWSGGQFRKWYGNNTTVADWQDDGSRIRKHPGSVVRNAEFQGLGGITYTKIGGNSFACRLAPEGHIFDDSGRMIFPKSSSDSKILSLFLNSSLAQAFLDALTPGLNYTSTEIGALPWDQTRLSASDMSCLANQLEETSRKDWDSFETSWNFQQPDWLILANQADNNIDLPTLFGTWSTHNRDVALEQQQRETTNNRIVAQAYGLLDEVPIDVPLHRVSLTRNVEFTYGPDRTPDEYTALEQCDFAEELISYAIGCMFGRYSLDKPGLILANEGSTLEDYLRLVPKPTFQPDPDNVLPVVDGDWFEDDIVTKLRQFLRTTLGEDHLTTNIQFLTNALGVKNLRDYFIAPKGKRRKSPFYDDHLRRYKKLPIYWMFSTPSGSFNALIYLHRYTPDTVSTVLNEYLREYQVKLEATVKNLEIQSLNATTAKDKAQADKQAKQLRETLLELRDYEHDILYPLATANTPLNLDDGVKNNYALLQPALRKIK